MQKSKKFKPACILAAGFFVRDEVRQKDTQQIFAFA